MSTRRIAPPFLILAAVAAASVAAAAHQPAPSASTWPHAMRDLVELYSADHNSVQRFHDLPWSEQSANRAEAFYREWQARLAEVDFDHLPLQDRIDYILLRHELESRLAGLALEQRQLTELEPLLPFREAILSLESARRRMEPLDVQAAAAHLSALPDQIDALRDRIKKAPAEPTHSDAADESDSADDDAELDDAQPDAETVTEESSGSGDDALAVTPVVARRAAGAVRALRRTLDEWHDFYSGFEPEFAWWVRRPHADAAKALDNYARFLQESIAGLKGEDDDPLIGDPIGRDALDAALRAEIIAYGPEELIAIAERDLAWCAQQARLAAREMGLGDDWKAALERVKQDHVPPGEQDDLVAALARDAIDFVRQRDLVTIPPLCEETWRVTMLSAQAQKTLPYAVYFGQAMGVAYATDEMAHDDKLMSMRGNNRHFTRIVTPHELIPGHHLQGYVSRRHNTHRSEFRTPFLVEGWAVYWEMRLWDLGYPGSPEDRLGMLFWRMHRGARVIVSLRFHLGQMSPAEMVDFLVERVGHERLGATSEVRRYIGGDYGPLYQCGYLIGAIQLRALHDELVGSGRMTDRQFNDAVLAHNAIPIEMIRAGLLGLDLAPDHRASWKFAGEVGAPPPPPAPEAP